MKHETFQFRATSAKSGDLNWHQTFFTFVVDIRRCCIFCRFMGNLTEKIGQRDLSFVECLSRNADLKQCHIAQRHTYLFLSGFNVIRGGFLWLLCGLIWSHPRIIDGISNHLSSWRIHWRWHWLRRYFPHQRSSDHWSHYWTRHWVVKGVHLEIWIERFHHWICAIAEMLLLHEILTLHVILSLHHWLARYHLVSEHVGSGIESHLPIVYMVSDNVLFDFWDLSGDLIKK